MFKRYLFGFYEFGPSNESNSLYISLFMAPAGCFLGGFYGFSRCFVVLGAIGKIKVQRRNGALEAKDHGGQS